MSCAALPKIIIYPLANFADCANIHWLLRLDYSREAIFGGFELANTESAKKRIRQTEKRTERNRHYKASARTYVKRVRRLIAENKLDEAELVAHDAYSTLDKAARKNIVHPSNAARRKGRLMAALAAARATAPAEKPSKK